MTETHSPPEELSKDGNQSPVAPLAAENTQLPTSSKNDSSSSTSEPSTSSVNTSIPTSTDPSSQPKSTPQHSPKTPNTPMQASMMASTSTSTSPQTTPAKRRPKPPTKGILKPPPPPAKPTLTNKIRDIVLGSVNVVGGGARGLFDSSSAQAEGSDGATASGSSTNNGRGGSSSSSGGSNGINGSGPSVTAGTASSGAAAVTAAVGGTLNAISGRFGLGLGRFVASPLSPSATPSSSPGPKNVSLPDTGASPVPMSEKSRQKQPLKRATFVLPSISITYPISSQGEPWSQKVLEDRKRIETTHKSLLTSTTGPEYWTSQRLVTLYESACRIREERPRVGVVRSLEKLPPPPRPRLVYIALTSLDPLFPSSTASTAPSQPSPQTVDTPFNRHAAEALADVLSAEWGLSDLRLENGVLESEDALKPILHALLISGTLPSLSLAGNKKIKAGGWRLVSVFLKRARSLKYMNLSDTVWDRKGIEHLVNALNCIQAKPIQSTTGEGETLTDPPLEKDKAINDRPSESEDKEDETDHSYGAFILPAPLLKSPEEKDVPAAIQTLRMDGCGLRVATLEPLASGIRSSDLKNISLRRNKIGPLGAVSLALMIRDYPDSASTSTLTTLAPTLNGTPSIHASPNSQDTMYTPYVPRKSRPNPDNSTDDSNLPPIPLVVSSPAGGVTSRIIPDGYKPPPPPKHPLVMPSGGNSAMQDGAGAGFVLSSAAAEGRLSAAEIGGASVALQRSVRALDGVERIGRLLTLDLKSNEIKNGVGYIAQVLKRNRTLKVLNLSDNKIEPSGLAALAEALKYNSSLETLDMSSNPCCGPSLEGIAALRTTFTVNASLKRLFLSETSLTTEGAIALAEFLPETKTLLHLDLTSNPLIDVAGIMAISVGLRSNTLIRCLDISIPPNNEDMSELSQNILQSCIRNTELAAAASASASSTITPTKAKSTRAGQEAIWAPIKKSALVRSVKEADEARAEKEREAAAKSPEGVAREYVYTLRPERVLVVSEETVRDLGKWFDAGRLVSSSKSRDGIPGGHVWEPGQLPKDDFGNLLERAKALRERLVEQVQETVDPTKLDRLLSLNDLLSGQIDQAKGFKPPPRLLLPSQIVPTTYNSSLGASSNQYGTGGSLRSPMRSNQNYNTATPSPPAVTTRHIQARRHIRIPSVEISSPNFSIGDSDGDSDAEELDVGNLSSSRGKRNSGLGLGSFTSNPSGSRLGKENQQPLIGILTGDDELKKGKDVGRIVEGGGGLVNLNLDLDLDVDMGVTSPVVQASRAWVEEEGEIFRKGTKLGVADEEEIEEKEEVSGEILRQEILDTPVARSPTRRLIHLEEEGGDHQIEGEDAS